MLNKYTALRGMFDYVVYNNHMKYYDRGENGELLTPFAFSGRGVFITYNDSQSSLYNKDKRFVVDTLDDYLAFPFRHIDLYKDSIKLTVEDLLTVLDEKIGEYDLFREKLFSLEDVNSIIFDSMAFIIGVGNIEKGISYNDYYHEKENYDNLIKFIKKLKYIPCEAFSHGTLHNILDNSMGLKRSYYIFISNLLKDKWDKELYNKVINMYRTDGRYKEHYEVSNFISNVSYFVNEFHDIPYVTESILETLVDNKFMEMPGPARKAAMVSCISAYDKKRSADNEKAIGYLIEGCKGKSEFEELGRTINRYYTNIIADRLTK